MLMRSVLKSVKHMEICTASYIIFCGSDEIMKFKRAAALPIWYVPTLDEGAA